MWRVIAALAALPACDPSCDEVDRVISPAGSQPGDVRAGVLFRSSRNHVAPRPGGGVVCVTCTGLVQLDAELREEGWLGPLAAPRMLALGPDETAYTTALRGGEEEAYEVVALEPGGAVRWRAALDAGQVPTAIAAGPEGVHVELESLASWSDPPAVIAFGGATGAVAWTHAEHLLGAARGGVFTVEPAEHAATLRHRGPAGAAVWERTLMTAGESLELHDAVATPEGGGIFAGRADAAVDLGDRVLPGEPGRPLHFVVEIDGAGATRWAFEAEISVEHVALTGERELLLAGRLDNRDDASRVDSFLALATAAGLARTHRIGGIASQLVEDLHAAPGGGAWVQVSSTAGEGEPAPSLEVGARRLDEPGTYLLEIVP